MCRSPAAFLGKRQESSSKQHVLADRGNPSCSWRLWSFKTAHTHPCSNDQTCPYFLRNILGPAVRGYAVLDQHDTCLDQLQLFKPSITMQLLLGRVRSLNAPYAACEVLQFMHPSQPHLLNTLLQGFQRSLMTYMQTPGMSK